MCAACLYQPCLRTLAARDGSLLGAPVAHPPADTQPVLAPRRQGTTSGRTTSRDPWTTTRASARWSAVPLTRPPQPRETPLPRRRRRSAEPSSLARPARPPGQGPRPRQQGHEAHAGQPRVEQDRGERAHGARGGPRARDPQARAAAVTLCWRRTTPRAVRTGAPLTAGRHPTAPFRFISVDNGLPNDPTSSNVVGPLPPATARSTDARRLRSAPF